jgi:signal transduction histidine kinase
MTTDAVRVLLVEDNPGDALLTRELLRETQTEYDVTHLTRLSEVEAAIGDADFDVVLLDLSLPDATGVETVTRAYELAQHLPIIVLTGHDDEEQAVAAMKAGAEDYLVKGRVDGALIARAVRYAIERKRLQNSHEQLRERLEAEHGRLRFLADAGMVLAASLDFEETLESVASLATRGIADFCVIDIIESDGETRRLRVAHADPEKTGLAQRLREVQLDRGLRHLASAALGENRTEHAEMSEELLRELAQSEEHLEIMRELEARSYIAVPLNARDRLLGALVLISSSRIFREEDVRLAEELARRAALAVDDARLYRHAHEVIRARDEVLRIVSHDLRNPLSTIAMSVEILLDPQVGFSEEQKIRQLHVVLRSAERMDRLIGDLLDVARLEAGRLSLDATFLDPARLVNEARELHLALATSRDQTLIDRSEGRLPPVLADRDRVLQVMGNLIGNAIKFTQEGGTITLRADRDGEKIRFAVCDDGPGIPPDQVTHLFRPFWQGRRGGRDGAGLGLAVSRGIVEAHGGEIRAESELGKGTCVSFTLPAAPERRADGT